MTFLPLKFEKKHLFVEIDQQLWLYDTGSPSSFGNVGSISIADEKFSLKQNYMGVLDAKSLSDFIGVTCVGLLGADILNGFDQLFDLPDGRIRFSKKEFSFEGQSLPMEYFRGVPIVKALIGGQDYRMVFDTGAPYSYFQEASLAEYPEAGEISDFYPGLGRFQVNTHYLPVSLAGINFTLQCGSFTGKLAQAMSQMNTSGIVGNEILCDRVVAYFPRRAKMVF